MDLSPSATRFLSFSRSRPSARKMRGGRGLGGPARASGRMSRHRSRARPRHMIESFQKAGCCLLLSYEAGRFREGTGTESRLSCGGKPAGEALQWDEESERACPEGVA